MMHAIHRSLTRLAIASKGDPVNSTLTVVVFWLMFTVVEAGIERMIFGERFEHFLDPIFAAGFIIYAALGVHYCATFNERKNRPKSRPPGLG